jgi:hypothetical protein
MTRTAGLHRRRLHTTISLHGGALHTTSISLHRRRLHRPRATRLHRRALHMTRTASLHRRRLHTTISLHGGALHMTVTARLHRRGLHTTIISLHRRRLHTTTVSLHGGALHTTIISLHRGALHPAVRGRTIVTHVAHSSLVTDVFGHPCAIAVVAAVSVHVVGVAPAVLKWNRGNGLPGLS